MPWKPTFRGERPTLGYLALDWMIENLARPESQDYEPFVPTKEQAEFIVAFYELNPSTRKRRVRRGVLSRSRGWGKSPMDAGIACFEALGPALCDGWDASGQPVGMPWSEVRKPLVEIAAVSEDQVNTNTWSPLIDMLSRGPVVDNYPGLEPMGGFVNLPFGRIQRRTAEARSAKGAPAHFAVCDQTEEWVSSNGGILLYNTLVNNVTKRGGHLLESPNAYTPGQGSVAESTMNAYRAQLEGRGRLESGLLFDHREAPGDTDLTDEASLLHGLAVAYGDSADVAKCAIHQPPCKRPGWVDLNHILARIWEPDADEQMSRSDWLNQITHASDSWISQPDWAARRARPEDDPIRVGDVICLGLDGSRGRAKGKPDATALIGCRVRDGRVFQVGVWEAGDQPESWASWVPPIVEIEAAIADCFGQYGVVGFFADPGRDWRSFVNSWEATYSISGRLKVKATVQHPIEWWMTGGRSTAVEAATEQCEGAILAGDLTHDGSASLTRHVLNARRRLSHGKLALAKESPASSKKIDAAVAMVLAWQCRLQAVAMGLSTDDFFMPYRIR